MFMGIEAILVALVLALYGFILYMDKRQARIDKEKLEQLERRLKDQKLWATRYMGTAASAAVHSSLESEVATTGSAAARAAVEAAT